MTLTMPTNSISSTPAQPTPLVPISSSSNSTGSAFSTVLDAINPLQHIPVVSTLYRAATGTQISGASQIAGDTMYGALLPGGAIAGLASSAANVAVKAITGQDIGQHIVSALTSSSTPSTTTTPTPLTPATASVTAAVHAAIGGVPAVPVMDSSRTQAVNGQYQRAQALDALNNQLIKMAV